jgi:hypothetical protein
MMRVATRGICILLVTAGAVAEMSMHMTVDRPLVICEARTVEAAAAKGDELSLAAPY